MSEEEEEEEEERELSLFANMDDFVCIAMGGEGRRNMRQAVAANGKRPAHSFTSPDAAPDNAQEYLCFEKETAQPWERKGVAAAAANRIITIKFI